MQIILVAKTGRRHRRFQLGPWATRCLALVGCAAVTGAGVAGYEFAERRADNLPDLQAAAWYRDSIDSRRRVEEGLAEARRHVDALALQLGEVQARAIRLDALGRRLVEMAELDPEEFAFDRPPAVGGPAPAGAGKSYDVPDFLASLNRLADNLDERAAKVEAIEVALMRNRLREEVRPSGRPVDEGWLSSFFGQRTDPISGRRAFHEGIDFAGKPKSDVLSVASGVVVFSGRRGGYGNVVDISHGNGYVTRYAHNHENTVQVGAKVKKGDRIALLGSTGDVTGPHVHFEVLRDGRPVDPLKFVRAGP